VSAPVRALVLAAAAALFAGCPRECEPAWRPVFDDAPGALLAGWGASEDDVFLVGGGLGAAGSGALALHWDGAAWRALDTAGRGDTLWWVWGAGPNDVWMVGENGLVLRWDGAALTQVPSGTLATLYGVWGPAPDDVWIVGGTVNGGPYDVVLHWDGQTLTPDTTIPATGVAFFKVWGSSANDMWITGERGTVWRRMRGAWENQSRLLPGGGTTTSLFTVHGCSPTEIYAVGGKALYRYDGTGWTYANAPAQTGFVNGVACGADEVLMVGLGGLKLRLDKAKGTWVDEQLRAPFSDFHGAWIGPGGSAWAIGGNFLDPAGTTTRVGVVGYHGCDPPAGL
jgi:hypothetical protein